MTVLEKIRNGLIVSCQAEEGSPFNTPKGVGDFARCAELGGAVGIRSCGVEKSLYIMQNTSLPVICLTKSTFDDGFVRITGSFAEVEALLNINATFIAVDGTNRLREKIYTGPDFIHKIKQMHPDILVMADIATPQEAVACTKRVPIAYRQPCVVIPPTQFRSTTSNPLSKYCKNAYGCYLMDSPLWPKAGSTSPNMPHKLSRRVLGPLS